MNTWRLGLIIMSLVRLFVVSSLVALARAGTNAAGLKFLEENKDKPGVITLPSGLQYKVLRAGYARMLKRLEPWTCPTPLTGPAFELLRGQRRCVPPHGRLELRMPLRGADRAELSWRRHLRLVICARISHQLRSESSDQGLDGSNAAHG
jgi:hypothetical protein